MEFVFLAWVEQLMVLVLKQPTGIIHCSCSSHSGQTTALITQQQKGQDDLAIQLTMETTG